MVKGKTSLLEMVRSGSVHHVLNAVKQEELPQDELNAALHEAAWKGDLQCARIVMAAGADVYSTGPQGETVLAEAVHSGSIAFVKNLLEQGYIIQYAPPLADGEGVENQQKVTPSPLHIGIAKHNVAMVEVLLDAGADPENRDLDGDTALISACCSGIAIELLPLMIKAGANLDAPGHRGNTALIQASERGMVDVLTELLKNGADANIQNEAGYNALLIACEVGNVDVVNLLATIGKCDVTASNKEGNNALHLAALNGDATLIEPLVKLGIDCNAQEKHGNTPLIVAACVHNQDFALQLIKLVGETLDYNIQGYGKRTALHFACENDLNALAFELLATKSVQPDLCDELGNTPLIQVCKQSNNELLTKMFKLDCEVNHRGDKGLTPAHWCILNHNAKGLKMLLDIVCLHTDMIDDEGYTPLLLAAKNQCGLEMLMLLKEEADMDVQDKDGLTALHWLITNGAHLFMPQFLKQGAKVSIPDNRGDTPLIYAVKYYEWKAMEDLIAFGADVNHRGFKGKTPLHFLCQSKMAPTTSEQVLAAFDCLVKHGADLSVIDNEGNHAFSLAGKQLNRELVLKMLTLVSLNEINTIDQEKKTLLFYFAQEGDFAVVLRLLKAGAEPDRDRSKSSALIEATKGGHEDIVNLLLNHGAIVDRKDHHRRSALMWAAQNGHSSIADTLIEHGAKTRRKDISKDTPLTLAAFHGHLNVLNILISVSDLNHCEREEGMSALNLAICKDFANCVRLLLRAGSDISVTDAKNNTALLNAAIHTTGTEILKLVLECKQQYDIDYQGDKERSVLHWVVGDPECVKLVLKYKPDLDLVDGNGATPLLLAIAHGQPESARYLIEAGCDMKKMHSDGRCAIHHACVYGDVDALSLILSKGFPVNALTKDGRSALLLACIEGHIECVKVLLKHNAKINTVYFDAVTVLSIAASNSHYEIMRMLLLAGADPDLHGSQKHAPLIASVINGDLEGAAILIQGGATYESVQENTKHPLQVAAIKGHLEILQALASIEIDVNFIRKMLQDGAVYYFVEDDDVLAELEQMTKTTRPLSMLCRAKVRSMLKVPILPKINLLPVPNMVKSYLRLADLMERVKKDEEEEDRRMEGGREYDPHEEGGSDRSEGTLEAPNSMEDSLSEPNVSDVEEIALD